MRDVEKHAAADGKCMSSTAPDQIFDDGSNGRNEVHEHEQHLRHDDTMLSQCYFVGTEDNERCFVQVEPACQLLQVFLLQRHRSKLVSVRFNVLITFFAVLVWHFLSMSETDGHGRCLVVNPELLLDLLTKSK